MQHGDLDVHAHSTLALVDSGCDAIAVMTQAEADRLGLTTSIKALDGGTGTRTLCPAGGSSIQVLGTVELQPVVRAQRRLAHVAHAAPHTMNVALPVITALVVDKPLAGADLILGERALRLWSADLCWRGARRALVLTGDVHADITIALLAGRSNACDEGYLATRRALAPIATAVADSAAADAAKRQQKNARWLTCLAMLDLYRAEDDDEPAARTEGPVTPRQCTPRPTPALSPEATNIAAMSMAALEQAQRDNASARRSGVTDDQLSLQLAEQLHADFAQSQQTQAAAEEEAERKKVHDLMKPNIDALMAHLESLADKRGAATTGAAPRNNAVPKPSMLSEDTVCLLNDEETRMLVDHMNALATSTMQDPSIVKRAPTATQMPFTAVLELKPEARDAPPTREGFKRSYSAEKMDAMRAQAVQMLRAGVIEPAGPHCRWAHAAVLVKKSDGAWRFCIDYRPLNSRLEVEGHAIPPIDEICRLLANEGGFYSRYDLKSAFWQVPLDENSRDMSAFYVPRMGVFRFTVLAFGLASATSLFQKTMEQILAPLLLRGVIVYVDDLIVYGKTKRELLERMAQVQALLTKFDLRVAPQKCVLMTQTIDVLGKRVSAGKIEANPDHLVALLNYPQPKTVQELRRFLGAAGWHRQHIPAYASITAPLYAMEKAVNAARAASAPEAATQHSRANDNAQITWTPAAVKSFEQLRRLWASPPVLREPDPNKLDNRLRIVSDAHETSADGKQVGGVGGALEWKGDDGLWHLVMATSRALSPAECNYTTTEVELLALVEIVKRAEQYLSKARGVQLITDHAATVHLNTMRERNGRLGRWSLWLTSFDAVVIHRPGTANALGDALSRAHSTPDGPIVGKLTELLRSDPAWVAAMGIGTTARGTLGDTTRRSLEPTSALAELVRMQLNCVAIQKREFQLIVADPAWAYLHTKGGGHNRVDTETLCALPVAQVAAHDAALMLWTTGPKLEDAMRVAHAWGFSPVTVAFIWDKGADNAHSGRYTNSQTEFVLLATRNEVRKKLLVSPSDARVGQLLREDPARTPGRKLPLAFWKALETMFRPGLQTLHLFASTRREGVFAIGDLTGPAATASAQPTPAVLVVPPVQVADDLSGAEKPRSAAPPRQPPPIPPRPTTLPKQAILVAPIVMEGSSDDDTLRPVPPAQPPPPMPARPTAPPKPVGERADEPHTPAARPPPPAPQADAAARPAEPQPPEEPRRPVGDAPEEQQAVMEMRARNQALLNADRNTVLLQLTVDPAARIALARLVKQCAERDKEQLEPSVARKLDAWLESPPAKCRKTIEHWKHQHRLTLDLHDVPDVELRAALLRLKADGKTDECLQWLLRDTERKRWLPALDFDALLRLCDERLANAAVVASGHTLAIPVVSMQRRGEKGSCDGGEVPRWLLPAQASEFRDAVIYEAHAALGHPGLARTMTLLSRTGWFIPRLAHHVTAVLRPCVPCSRRKGEPSKWTPVPGVLPSAHQAACFNHRVHVDLIGPLTVNKGQRYIVSFTDAFTRWPEAFVIANKTAALVARRFLDEWVCRYGPPVQLVSDQGSEFVAEVLRTVTAALGVHHFTTTPYHPQANGLEERAHKTLEATIALLGQEQAKGAGEWAELLPQALFAMRTLVHRGTRHTPMHLVFGCEAMLPDALYSCKSVRKHMLDGAVRMEVLGERPEFAKSSSQKQRDDFTHIDQAVNKRAHELRELWQRLYDCAVKEERAVAEEGVRNDVGQDADAAGKQTPAAATGAGAVPAPPLIIGKFQTGDYVRVFNGDLLAKNTNVLNPKLEARRWTKPWRVQNVIRGAALVLTLATDPLLSRTESCLRVKKIELPEMLREQYDKLYSDAMADKQRHREAQRKDATDRVEWSYPGNEPPGVYVTEVLSIRGKGADRELRVRWSDHTVTWEGYSKISNVAAEPLGVFRQKQQEEKDLGPAHLR